MVQPADTDPKAGRAQVPRQRVRHPKLDSFRDLRMELGRVYRQARAGLLDTADAARFVSMLQTAGKLLEADEIEGRMREIERRLSNGRSY